MCKVIGLICAKFMQLTSFAMHVFTTLKGTSGFFSSVRGPGGIPFLVLQAGGFLPGSLHLSKAKIRPTGEIDPLSLFTAALCLSVIVPFTWFSLFICF